VIDRELFISFGIANDSVMPDLFSPRCALQSLVMPSTDRASCTIVADRRRA
jgi:hypothetical protein